VSFRAAGEETASFLCQWAGQLASQYIGVAEQSFDHDRTSKMVEALEIRLYMEKLCGDHLA
jgi:hypothetical protein